MRKVLTDEDAVRRRHLVDYDSVNPSPYFSPEQICYFEPLPDGLSEKALENLRKTEWFVLNRNSGYFIECAVPGLRSQPGIEVGYVRRFSTASYVAMMDVFLDCMPTDFPLDQANHFNMPSYRLTSATREKFYPVEYNGEISAWRRRLQHCAEIHNTSIGSFDYGKPAISDGRELDLGDILIEWVRPEPDPSDW